MEVGPLLPGLTVSAIQRILMPVGLFEMSEGASTHLQKSRLLLHALWGLEQLNSGRNTEPSKHGSFYSVLCVILHHLISNIYFMIAIKPSQLSQQPRFFVLLLHSLKL